MQSRALELQECNDLGLEMCVRGEQKIQLPLTIICLNFAPVFELIQKVLKPQKGGPMI